MLKSTSTSTSTTSTSRSSTSRSRSRSIISIRRDGETDKNKKSIQDRLYRWSTRVGVPINRVTNKLGCEAWWPTSLDKECDKCARILKSFVQDGVYTDDSTYPIPSPYSVHFPGPAPKIDKTTKTPLPSRRQHHVVKIPPHVIAQAKGIAIFTSFRTGGPQIGGAGGSGVVMVRLPDGSWSPPSGILPNNLSVGFMLGLDVYDCVCVLNTQQAVDAFTRRARVSLGGDVGIAAGPLGAGVQLDAGVGCDGPDCINKNKSQRYDSYMEKKQRGIGNDDNNKNQALMPPPPPASAQAAPVQPVWSYARSRGFYVGATVAGTVIIERPDANGMFYGEKKIRPWRILTGDVVAHPWGSRAEDGSRMWPEGAARLMEVVRDAEMSRGRPRAAR